MSPVGRKLSAISLFSGAGGLDHGISAAGFDVRVALDSDADSCATLTANSKTNVVCDDIVNVESRALMRLAGVRRRGLDLLFGGPPCQPFSKSGYWARGDALRLEDPRANTLPEFMRCVGEMLPRVFLFENVHGISYSGKEEGLRYLQRLTRRINRESGVSYQLSWAVLNAAEYGVPQARVRFFLVGHRQGESFRFPEPTHGEGSLFADVAPFVTAWDAIGGLAPPADEDLAVKGRWADLLPSIPEGQNYLWHTPRGGGLPLFGWRTRFWTFLLKLAKDRPSWTIQAQPGPAVGPFHWENRRLSVEEMARLQTFPRNLSFVGSRVSVQRQLGNAVPSLLAEVLGLEIREQLLGMVGAVNHTLRVEPKGPPPPAARVKPVAKKFHELIGDHAEHPGEGRGQRARKLRDASAP